MGEKVFGALISQLFGRVGDYVTHEPDQCLGMNTYPGRSPGPQGKLAVWQDARKN